MSKKNKRQNFRLSIKDDLLVIKIRIKVKHFDKLFVHFWTLSSFLLFGLCGYFLFDTTITLLVNEKLKFSNFLFVFMSLVGIVLMYYVFKEAFLSSFSSEILKIDKEKIKYIRRAFIFRKLKVFYHYEIDFFKFIGASKDEEDEKKIHRPLNKVHMLSSSGTMLIIANDEEYWIGSELPSWDAHEILEQIRNFTNIRKY